MMPSEKRPKLRTEENVTVENGTCFSFHHRNLSHNSNENHYITTYQRYHANSDRFDEDLCKKSEPSVFSRWRDLASPRKCRLLKSYHNLHRHEQNARRELASCMKRNQWRGVERKDDDDYAVSAKSNCYFSEATKTKEIETKLLIRSINSDFSSSRIYQNIHYLNSNAIVAVDNFGELDIVAVPLQSTYEPNVREGMGRFLFNRLKLLDKSMSYGNEPRTAMDSNIELFGYEGGEKIAVGLESGRMELVSSGCNSSRVSDMRSEKGHVRSNPFDVDSLWSCLPLTDSTKGPLRRFQRNESFSLSRMLATTDKEELLQTVNNYTTFDEIPNWDCGNATFRRESSVQPRQQFPARGGQWAFREGGTGGGSGTALLGAFVDSEMDCFSLRVVDERMCESSPPRRCATSCIPATVFVDTSSRKLNNSNFVEDVVSICFAGEYGLVTAHVASPINYRSGMNQNIVKFWDHRMLLSNKPVSQMNLTFPRDKVCGVTCHEEASVSGYLRGDEKEESSLQFTEGSLVDDLRSFRITKLTGSRDSSDRFAISLTATINGESSDSLHLIADSTRACIVQQISTSCQNSHDHVSNPSFSANLDVMACFSTNDLEIYDISRYKKQRTNFSCIHDRPSTSTNGKKRQLMCLYDSKSKKKATDYFLRKCNPKIHDVYGIDSTVSCMAMDYFGGSIACGTHDGDIFIIQP